MGLFDVLMATQNISFAMLSRPLFMISIEKGSCRRMCSPLYIKGVSVPCHHLCFWTLDTARGPRGRHHACKAVGRPQGQKDHQVGEEIADEEEAGSPHLNVWMLSPIDERQIRSCISVKRLISASSEHAIDVVEESVAKRVNLTRRLEM